MSSNIIKDIENYIKFQEDISGGSLYLGKLKINIPQEDIPVTQDIPKVEPKVLNAEKAPVEQNQILSNTSVSPDWKDSQTLPELYEKIHNCLECKLGSTRTKFVFGTGNPNADIMVIGEAPGKDEDLQGEPFVGRAGQLLTKILAAINLSRDDVFIANIIKCRPPGNRRPEKEEVAECEPYLHKQIEIIKPRFILALGLTAVDTLLGKKHKMADIRGNLTDYHGTKMMVTYHPAALLRNPNWKKETWEDVKHLRKLYDEYLKNQKEN